MIVISNTILCYLKILPYHIAQRLYPVYLENSDEKDRVQVKYHNELQVICWHVHAIKCVFMAVKMTYFRGKTDIMPLESPFLGGSDEYPKSVISEEINFIYTLLSGTLVLIIP